MHKLEKKSFLQLQINLFCAISIKSKKRLIHIGLSIHLTTKRAALLHLPHSFDSLSSFIYCYLIVLPFTQARAELCWLLHD